MFSSSVSKSVFTVSLSLSFQPLSFSFHAFNVFLSILYQVRSPLPFAYHKIFFLTKKEAVHLHPPKTHLFWQKLQLSWTTAMRPWWRKLQIVVRLHVRQRQAEEGFILASLVPPDTPNQQIVYQCLSLGTEIIKSLKILTIKQVLLIRVNIYILIWFMQNIP